MLSRGAMTTIVPNEEIERVVNRWECHAFVLGFTPGNYPTGEQFPLNGQFNVAVVSTFAEDEPLDVVLEAASRLPEVSFYVTGDSNRIPPHFLARKPDNCHFTGYLPYERYVGLLRGADAIIDLTTRDHTLLMGAYEAVSLGVPLITSDWPILQDSFSRGTVHVPNTVEGVCEGVRQARPERSSLQRDILCLQAELRGEWEQRFAELQQMLANGR